MNEQHIERLNKVNKALTDIFTETDLLGGINISEWFYTRISKELGR